MQPLQRANPVPLTPQQMQAHLENADRLGIPREDVLAGIRKDEQADHFINDTYHVQCQPVEAEGWPKMLWLSIKRRDREPIHDWRDLQEIKNQILSPEHEGFGLYPAESRKVDTSNQYHLYVFLDPTVRMPVGFTERLVDDRSVRGSKTWSPVQTLSRRSPRFEQDPSGKAGRPGLSRDRRMRNQDQSAGS